MLTKNLKVQIDNLKGFRLRLFSPKGFWVFLMILFLQNINAQGLEDRPKIVVGVVVDQMRWDYLYRYQDRYMDGGFKRLLQQGFTCENVHINYSPTSTGPGHSCVYTGSVPAIHGIIGNSWYDRSVGRSVNCVEDTSVQNVGVPHKKGGPRSPRQLLVTTIGDELKLSNNSRSKVVAVSFKDRGAILPGGHMSNGSYWFDNDTGKFKTSTYYMSELPQWVNDFNHRKLSDYYLTQTWKTLYPIETYVQSTEDNKPYEWGLIDKEHPVFPFEYSTQDNGYAAIAKSAFGNILTFEMAKAAIEGEGLGTNDFTDMIAISFSATDAIGHAVGPNAIEIEDTYLRLDQEFAEFFTYLDNRFGSDGYLFFITADHGVSHSPGFLKEKGVPTGDYTDNFVEEINDFVKNMYGIDKAIISFKYEIYLNWTEIRGKNTVDEENLMNEIILMIKEQPGVLDAWPSRKLGLAPWPETIKERFINGYNALRGGDIQIVFQSGWKQGIGKGANHGSWHPYDSHIPLVWMGWNVEHGQTNRYIEMSDIAPTLAAMLKIQMPSGSIGTPILEITDKR